MFDLKAFREQSLPTQAQIISQWEGNLTSPLVSVICTAYNQESYIEDALKGFLMQKTDFPFEIIIHDDASTDKTADIINDYTKKYPLIIKPTLQKDNQYSINGHLPFINCLDKSIGEFVAICEGDDFWFRADKLQKQVSILLKSSKNLTFHSGYMLSGFKLSKKSNNINEKKIYYSDREVIRMGANLMHTASIMFRKKTILPLPDWFSSAPVGDLYIQILSGVPKGAIYLPIEASVYRAFSEGSWSQLNQKQSESSLLNYVSSQRKSLDYLQETIGNKYRNDISELKSKMYYGRALLALSNSHYSLFATLIEESYKCGEKFELRRMLFYKLRFFTGFLKFILKIKP